MTPTDAYQLLARAFLGIGGLGALVGIGLIFVAPPPRVGEIDWRGLGYRLLIGGVLVLVIGILVLFVLSAIAA